MNGLRILFATDGSPGAGRALSLLKSSLDPAGVETVEVLSVVQAVSQHGQPAGDAAAAGLIGESRHEAATRVVAAAAAVLRAAGFETVETVREGHAAETIITHAATGEHCLVVLGTRGLRGLRRQLIGSVSGMVARYGSTSVLVAQTAGPIRQVVLGYDASPGADEALDLVARTPLRNDPPVTVCSTFDVVAPVSFGMAPTMTGQVLAAYDDSLRWAQEAAEAMADSAATRLRERGVTADGRTSRGPAHEQLVAMVRSASADLLVVGSRGLSAVQRFMLGSTSATLVGHPPTSVLVARRDH